MADDQNVGVNIKTTADTSGADKAKDALRGVGSAAKETADAAQETVGRLGELAIAFGALVEIGKVVEFLKESVEEFYNNERAMRAVDSGLKTLNGDYTLLKKSTGEWIDEMARLGGVSDDKVAGALGRQITLTGSLEQAQSRVGLAMDIATKYGLDFSEGMRVLEAATNGQMKALVAYIPGIKNYTEVHEVSRVAIDFLEKSVRGATLATHDNALAADQAKIRWEQFKEKIGGEVAPVLTEFRNGLMSFPRLLTLLSDLSVVWADAVGRNVKALANLLKYAWQDPLSAWKSYNAERLANQLATDAAIAKAYAVNQAEFAAQEGLKTKAATDAAKTRVKSNLDALTIETKTNHDFWESDWKAFNANEARKAKALLTYYKNLAKMKKDDTSDTLRHFGIQETAEDELQRHIQALIKKTLAMKKEAAKKEMEIAAGVAGGVLNLAGAAFGQTKEIQIAQAIISGLLGYMKTVETIGLPWGAVIGALSIAAGIATAAQISSTSPAGASGGNSTAGTGFDDPTNDAAARQGGRRWANDMIREFSSGASAGWADGMRGGTTNQTYDNRNINNVTINGGILGAPDVEMAKRLKRTLDMVAQNQLGNTRVTR